MAHHNVQQGHEGKVKHPSTGRRVGEPLTSQQPCLLADTRHYTNQTNPMLQTTGELNTGVIGTAATFTIQVQLHLQQGPWGEASAAQHSTAQHSVLEFEQLTYKSHAC